MEKTFLIFINQTRNINLNQYQSQFEEILEKILKPLKLANNLEISVTFVTKSAIKKINLEHLGKNITTDVLSFKSEIPLRSSKVLADIFICPPKAKINAQKAAISEKREILQLFIHALMHISDLDHEKPQMKEKWDLIFKKLTNIIEEK
ncbi:MAG TPA: rRNA maturation RNase YbeY [Patescibacteria group bacterium]|nr:rRNA maturation RNase YbeY [Patescibacteria group bacterium]